MKLIMSVHRQGGQFIGSLRRPEGTDVLEFWGVLELVAALEALTPNRPGSAAVADDAAEGR
jgi:hypothetical protein